ncbi:PREDICTED: uncharacterized protein LOC108764528 [Trachymyrmex cornetzi]|uniref:uncharacterized protein LOC108764528 n=1 Tax=Trachymyrmex cornetzi TaxID=471704 RepID=UPI00084F647D|nr:PREDICTED: uncharacterized protein LOC108764528 [Trachymyrmex cornetzi]
MPPKGPSGSEFRKRKRDKENEDKKMSKVLMSWTKPNLNLSQNCPSNFHADNIEIYDIVTEICQEPEPTTSHHDEQMNQIASLDITDLDLVDSVLQDQQDQSLEISKALQLDNASASDLDRNDPQSWFPLNDSIRNFLIEQGPDQGKWSTFSLSDTTNRKFSKEWFRRKLANGQFPSNSASSLTNPARGFNDWRHLSPRIPDHENSVLHHQEKEKWRHILKVHIDVMFCAENNLASRGSHEKIGEPGSDQDGTTMEEFVNIRARRTKSLNECGILRGGYVLIYQVLRRA